MRKILIGIVLLTGLSFAAELNQRQIDTLNEIREVAKQMPNKVGHTFEDTMSAMALTESSGGLNNVGDLKEGDINLYNASLGPLQVRVSTMRYLSKVKSKYKFLKEKTDKEIAFMLLENNKFNTEAAMDYFLINYGRFKVDKYFKAVSLHNGGVRNYAYVDRVLNNMKIIKEAKEKGLLL